jgi:exopolyphosphatase/guanosine-5'-triphosphate,3'-diphosphate pyrophosphatase
MQLPKPHLQRCAAIDVGTNSVLMLIAERGPGNRLRRLVDYARITRLGEGLGDSGTISPEAATRTIAALTEYKRLAGEFLVDEILVVGTMCLRNAKNTSEFIERIRSELELELRVIPGDEEARLTFMGARSGLPPNLANLLVFDVGGGSTEFVRGSGTEIRTRFSRDVGAVGLTEQFLKSDPVGEQEYRDMVKHLVGEELADLQAPSGLDAVVGVGGTLTTMVAVMLELKSYDGTRVHASRLTRDEIERQLTWYLGLTRTERAHIAGMEKGRADVMVAGAAIVLAVLRKLEADEVVVSDRGLRHGLLQEKFDER